MQETPLFLSVLWIVYLASIVFHGCYVLFFHGRFLFIHRKPLTEKEETYPPLSVLIAARNESENLYELLPKLMEQDYPRFEVVIVNNQSTDDSAWLIKAFQREYPNLKIVQLDKNRNLRPGKKLPLTLGIKAAKYDHFILTDADCMPNSRQWLRSMAEGFLEGKEIILGYGPMVKKPGFLNRLIRFDTSFIALNYMSFALARLPYMGVGRNLGYSRKVFEAVGGFKSHYGLASGDDDLFIQQAARKGNYTLQTSPASFCYSDAHTEWFRWRLQKTRHYTTSGKYQVIKKTLLGIYPVTLWMTAICFILLCLTNNAGILAWSSFGGLLLMKWGVQGRGLWKLNERGLAWFFPWWDFLYSILIPLLYWSAKRKAKTTW